MLNLTIGTTYRIDGLRDAGTGTSDYDRWRYLGLRNGWATFDGSTPDPVFVRPDELTRGRGPPRRQETDGMADPTTVDNLTTGEVLALLATAGRPIEAATWRAYVARGQAPAPVRHVGRTPLWDRSDVEAWAKR